MGMQVRDGSTGGRDPAVIFRPTAIEGAYIVAPERHHDDRGFFARTFSTEEFAALGLDTAVSQCSVSCNTAARTLRGMHYQAEPYGESKLIRCTQGAAFDVLVDLRRDSPTYRSVLTEVLDPEDMLQVFAPQGVAHGFLTLVPGTELFYQISSPHRPDAGRGLRWDDLGAGIPWPHIPNVISKRDNEYPDFVW